jgi:hypothetical protein
MRSASEATKVSGTRSRSPVSSAATFSSALTRMCHELRAEQPVATQKSTIDPHQRLPHTHARMIEMAVL